MHKLYQSENLNLPCQNAGAIFYLLHIKMSSFISDKVGFGLKYDDKSTSISNFDLLLRHVLTATNKWKCINVCVIV